MINLKEELRDVYAYALDFKHSLSGEHDNGKKCEESALRFSDERTLMQQHFQTPYIAILNAAIPFVRIPLSLVGRTASSGKEV